MRPTAKYLVIVSALMLFTCSANAQIDDICRESGSMPSLDSPFAHVPYVYGRVILKGLDATAKRPKVTVSLGDGQQTTDRWTIGNSGNYCFQRKGGAIVVEIDGVEAARRTLPSLGPAQQREDFEIYLPTSPTFAPPSVISAKFSRPKNDKTAELYTKTLDAEKERDLTNATEYLKEIVKIDATDFIAWAKLGTLYFELKQFTDAGAAYRKSLELEVEYTPAWISAGQLRLVQKQFETAIEIFKHAIELDPTSARAHQLLGEAYLLARKGTLGAEALNQAIKLDPQGMAECHLQLAHLYQLAGSKNLATKEYKAFLAKVPEHADKKKFQKFIKDNPE